MAASRTSKWGAQRGTAACVGERSCPRGESFLAGDADGSGAFDDDDDGNEPNWARLLACCDFWDLDDDAPDAGTSRASPSVQRWRWVAVTLYGPTAGMTLVFLGVELRQLYTDGFASYLSSMWKYASHPLFPSLARRRL